MGSSKRNLLTSILLLVVMGVFAVLTIFIVVDAINKKYYNDIKVEYEVQEESPNVILTFARNEGSNFGTDNTKVVLNEDKTKFRIDGTVPTIENGIVTNLDDLTSNDGREFYFFSTNSSFIDPQEDPENPNFIFSDTDFRYYVSTEDNPIWYDVPKSSENLTLYSVFLTPNVHNSDFANAPLNTIINAIVSHEVVDLPREAFGGSRSTPSVLTTILLPENLQSIGEYAFQYSTLTNIIIPKSVISIGEYAFYYCSSLETVNFGGNSMLTSIGDYAFSGCSSLTSITIPESVTSIGRIAFTDCSSLKTVTFGENSQLTSIGEYAFYYCSSLETVTFGENSQLTSIGERAFYNCSSLTSITIPESVTSIGSYAFRYCYKLVEVYDLTGSDGLKITAGSSSNGDVGYYAVEIKKENIPTGIYDTGTNNEYVMYEDLNGNHYFVFYKGQSGDIKLPTFDDRTYAINDYAFYNEDKLTSVTISSSVTSIGSYAFENCSSLTSITIPKSVTSIGSYAVRSCSSLTSITIPNSVTSIGSGAFFGCDNIQALRIDDLTSYLNISYGNSYSSPLSSTNQAVSLYEGKKLITNLVIPNEVIAIPSYAFRGTNITSVTIPESITTIESSAFSYCSSLTSITIPNSVTSIGNQAFRYCSSLETVTFGENSQLTSIGSYAFSNCSSLSSITIPDSVTSIGDSAFRYCGKLTIYCEVESEPSGWSWQWNYSNRPVYWAGEWKMVDGVPEPIE